VASARDILRHQAIAERRRIRDAVRAVLAGEDTPGRRWLIDFLRDEAPGQIPKSLAFAADRWFASQIRPFLPQLKREFADLLESGVDHGDRNTNNRQEHDPPHTGISRPA